MVGVSEFQPSLVLVNGVAVPSPLVAVVQLAVSSLVVAVVQRGALKALPVVVVAVSLV